jgi:uncharacterized protein YcbX
MQLLPDGRTTTWRDVAGPPSPASAQGCGVRAVGFAHIKGTRHEARPGAVFDAHGPIGDREFCFVDVERRQVLKTVQNPRLVGIKTVLGDAEGGDVGSVAGGFGDGAFGVDERELTMTLPDGRSAAGVPSGSGEWLTCDYWKRPVDLELTEGLHSDLASEWLGKPVRLARVPRGAVVFGSALSIVTTASLRDLSRRLTGEQHGAPYLVEEVARFRATAVLDTVEPYAEETWEGQIVDLGGGVRVRIGAPIPRCAVMDLDPITGERNAPVLKTLAGFRPRNDSGEPYFGVYAEVVNGEPGPAQ